MWLTTATLPVHRWPSTACNPKLQATRPNVHLYVTSMPSVSIGLSYRLKWAAAICAAAAAVRTHDYMW